MNFKPGDKVWIDNARADELPIGTYAGVVLRHYQRDWWLVEIEGFVNLPDDPFIANEYILRHRDDPPPQQEPKREATGDWDLCPWRPSRVPTEVA